MRRRIAATSLALGALSVLGLGCGGSPSPETQEIGRLFTQTATSGTLEPVGERRFALELQGVAPQVVWLSDRPARGSGHIPIGDFVRSWAGLGFRDDPPNAAITLLDGAPDEDTVVLELGSPRYDASSGTVRYPARVLDEANGNLSHLESQRDKRISRRFRDASLFIDDASADVISGCVIAPHTQCPGADLSGTDLRQANLQGANLERANLSNTDLTLAYFVDADLGGATLSGATLTGAILARAFLANANLSGANLTKAYLSDAVLYGANLSGARFCRTVMPNDSINNRDC